jgi:hypothetical protein
LYSVKPKTILIMKKLFSVLILLSLVFPITSQTAFNVGNIGVNAGVGVGWPYGYGLAAIDDLSPVPSINLSGEYGVFEIPSVGVISVGAFASYRKATDSGTERILTYSYDYEYSYVNTILALRGVFHFGFFDTGGFDLYAGIHTGVRLSSYDYETESAGLPINYDDSGSNSYFIHDIFAGGRYFLSDNIGFFSEIGYGISFFKIGVTFKF